MKDYTKYSVDKDTEYYMKKVGEKEVAIVRFVKSVPKQVLFIPEKALQKALNLLKVQNQ